MHLRRIQKIWGQLSCTPPINLPTELQNPTPPKTDTPPIQTTKSLGKILTEQQGKALVEFEKETAWIKKH